MFANRLKFFPLENPVKYKVEQNKIETIVEKPEFKQEVLYQGYTKGTIKISNVTSITTESSLTQKAAEFLPAWNAFSGFLCR